MKKIKSLVFILMCFLNSFAQKNPLSDVGTVELPKSTIKLTREQAINFVQENFKHRIVFKNPDNVYSINGIIVSFQDEVNMQDYKVTLKDQKAQMDWIFKKHGGKILTSKIIMINNLSFFVFEFEESGDERDLSFTTDFRNAKTLYCIVHYKKSDTVKANAIFNEVLNGVHYKN